MKQKRLIVATLATATFLAPLVQPIAVGATADNGTMMQYFEWYLPNDGNIGTA